MGMLDSISRQLIFPMDYILIYALQKEVLRGTEYFNATMKTIQLKVIKVAARVKEMKTKIHIELPVEFPAKLLFEKCFGIFETLCCQRENEKPK